MTDSPNTAPAYMQTMGIIGQPVDISNQVCDRLAPGENPVIIYDPTQNYAQNNGALAEQIEVMARGVMVQTVLLFFHKLPTETTPTWRLAGEVFLPAVTAAPNNNILTTSPAGTYPLSVPLKKILSPVSSDANNPHRGLRLNSLERPFQWGVGVGTAIASPVTVTMYGGEY